MGQPAVDAAVARFGEMFYAAYEPVLEMAAEHGCLTEAMASRNGVDIPIQLVCRACSYMKKADGEASR